MNEELVKKSKNELLTASLGKLIPKYSFPAIASMLFMGLYQVVDGIMVGRSLGPDALSSINILFPVVAVLIGLAMMLGTGGNARIAVLLGANKKADASAVLGLLIVTGTILGAIGSVLIYFLMPWILKILGTSGMMGIYAAEYLEGLLPFVIFMVLIFILAQAVRNDNKPAFSGIIMALCAILNIILDYLFLFVWGFGIKGAAYATGISQTLGALVFLIYFAVKTINRKKGIKGLYIGKPKNVFPTLLKISVNGFSEFFNTIAAGVTTFITNRTVIYYVGNLGVAALALYHYMLMIVLHMVFGLGDGIQPILSQNFGAKKHKRVFKTYYIATAAASALGIIMFFLLAFQFENMAGIFLPDNAEALRLAAEANRYLKWSVLLLPAAILGSIFFTSLEKAKASFIIAFFRSLVLPSLFMLTLPRVLDATGIWLNALIVEFISLSIILLYILITKKQLNKVSFIDNKVG